jgi:hypothetical protein
MTAIAIHKNQIWVNGKPTYEGRNFEGLTVEGMLFNNRAVQATFDDQNPNTQRHWAYPDTGFWDPERNVTEFIAALSQWKDHGVLGVTLNFQGGGGCYRPEIYDQFENNGFTLDGMLKPAYADRMARVLERIDELGMVAIIGIFYLAMANKMTKQESLWRAARNALAFLSETGHQNLLIEIANETNIGYFKDPIFTPENATRMIRTLREEHPDFYFSTSLVGMEPDSLDWLPSQEMIATCDYVLIHGKILENSEMQRNPKPLIINEDSPELPNMEAAWKRHVSWGYYDQGNNGENTLHPLWVDPELRPREDEYEELSGFQTPPINWGINTPEKRAFFDRVAEITGAKGPVSNSEKLK